MGNLYPIREVSRVTGVNAVTLRAWERRYGLIVPLRTNKGHRVYNDEHIHRIKRITDWIGRGVPVGKVRSLLDDPGENLSHLTSQGDDEWQGYLQEFMGFVSRFRSERMDSFLNKHCKLYPTEMVTERLLRPAFSFVEDRWSRGIQGAAAEKAFLKSHIRNWIGFRIANANQNKTSPAVLCVNLPEEADESDSLFLALSVSARGGQAIYLPSGLSLAEITVAAVKSECSGIVLHSHRSLRSDTLERGIPKLVQVLQKPVAMSGQCTTIHGAELNNATVVSLGENPGSSVRTFMEELI